MEDWWPQEAVRGCTIHGRNCLSYHQSGGAQDRPSPILEAQAFMRQIVRACLPLGDGLLLGPFMGGGSTIAAAVAVGYRSIGVESDSAYFEVATKAIPELAALSVSGTTGVKYQN